MKKPKAPAEPAEAKVARERQIAELASLDEEENRRIKQLFKPRVGGRAFRPPLTSRRAGAGNNPSQSGASAAGAAGVGPGGAAGGVPDYGSIQQSLGIYF